MPGRDVLAADHERQLDALGLHLVEPAARAARARASRARSLLTGFVRGGVGGRKDARGAHRCDSTIPAVSATHVSYEARRLGAWGRSGSTGDRLPAPRAASSGGRAAAARDHALGRPVRALLRRRARRLPRRASIELDGATEFELELTEALRADSGEARPSPTESWRRSPAVRTRSVQPDRSAPATASRSSSRATGSWPPTGSAPTGRSSQSTNGDCWSSKVSLSEELRNELAGIKPERTATGSRSSPGLRTRPAACHIHGRGRDRAASRPRQLGGCPARLQPASRARRDFGDPDIPAARLRAGDALPAPRRGSGSGASEYFRRPASSALVARRSSGRRSVVVGPGVLPGRLPPRGAARRAGRSRAAVASPRDPDGDARGRRVRRRDRGPGGVHLARAATSGRHAVAYAKGTAPIADVLAAAGASDAVLVLEEHGRDGGDEGAREPARERGSREPRAHEPRGPGADPGRAPAAAAAAGLGSLPPKLRRSPGCGSAIRRCPCASWRSDAALLRRNPRYSGAFRASSGSPGCRARNECVILRFAAGLCSSGGWIQTPSVAKVRARFNGRGGRPRSFLRPARSYSSGRDALSASVPASSGSWQGGGPIGPETRTRAKPVAASCRHRKR